METEVDKFLEFIDKLDFSNEKKAENKILFELSQIEEKHEKKYIKEAESKMPVELQLKKGPKITNSEPFYLQNKVDPQYLENKQEIINNDPNLNIEYGNTPQQISDEFFIQTINPRDVYANSKHYYPIQQNMQFKELKQPSNDITNAQYYFLQKNDQEFLNVKDKNFNISNQEKNYYPKSLYQQQQIKKFQTPEEDLIEKIQYGQKIQNLGGINSTIKVMENTLKQYELQNQEFENNFIAFNPFEQIKVPNRLHMNQGPNGQFQSNYNIPGQFQFQVPTHHSQRDPFNRDPLNYMKGVKLDHELQF